MSTVALVALLVVAVIWVVNAVLAVALCKAAAKNPPTDSP